MELNDMKAGTPRLSRETAEMRDVIIACDFSSAEETLAFLNRFGEDRPFVKIGMELYYAAGPDIVRQLKARGHRVFLDLKLHDIPNTVKKAMRVLSGLGADIVNLHAAGAGGSDPSGRFPAAADCGDAADQYGSGADGERASDFSAAG